MRDIGDGPRSDALLKSLESRFLHILAEHEASKSPKANGGSSNAVPPGTVSSAGTEASEVRLTIGVSRAQLEVYADALFHVIDHGCEVGLSTLSTLGGATAHGLIDKAEEAGWYEIDDDEEEL